LAKPPFRLCQLEGRPNGVFRNAPESNLGVECRISVRSNELHAGCSHFVQTVLDEALAYPTSLMGCRNRNRRQKESPQRLVERHPAEKNGPNHVV